MTTSDPKTAAKKTAAPKGEEPEVKADPAKNRPAEKTEKKEPKLSRKEQLAADRPVMRGGGVKVSDTTQDLNPAYDLREK